MQIQTKAKSTNTEIQTITIDIITTKTIDKNNGGNQQNNRYDNRNTPNQQQNRNNKNQQLCKHCNRTNHQTRDCQVCFNSGRMGHIPREGRTHEKIRTIDNKNRMLAKTRKNIIKTATHFPHGSKIL